MKKNVLIVDDCPVMRMVIKRTIRLCGLEINLIEEAGDGKEGLKKLKRNHFDLMIVDLNMPVMDGSQMIAQIKEEPAYRNIPIITVSAESNKERLNLIEEISDSFVHKPFTPEILRDQLLKLFETGAITKV